MSDKCVLNKSTLSGIADAIRAKGGTTEPMKPGEMAAAVEAIPGGGVSGDVVLDLVASGSYDVTLDWPCHLLTRTSLETASSNTNLVSLGCEGDNLSKWEAESTLGRTDAKLHVYVGGGNGDLLIQPQINEGTNNWGSGSVYLFVNNWEFGHCVETPIEIRPDGRILIFGRDIDEANIQDRLGANVFARCLAALRADWTARGKIHVSDTQTATVREITELYNFKKSL